MANKATARIGASWTDVQAEQARAAFLADFRADPYTSPDTFAGWVEAVVVEHAQLSPAARAAARTHLHTDTAADTQEGELAPVRRVRGFTVAATVGAVMEAALAADHAANPSAELLSRSDLITEAVALAVERARTRDGHLPPAPAHLKQRRMPRPPRPTRDD